jgi:gliding motility-associated protein GldE
MISASEVAFFSIGNNPRNLREGNLKEKALRLLEKPKSLLAAILIANNFINVAIILISTFISAQIIDVANTEYWIVFLIQVVLITFIILLFGEILPKILATIKTEFVVLNMAYPLFIIGNLFAPIIYLLVNSTSFIDNKLKTKNVKTSVDELSKALEITNIGEDSEEEHKILKGIVEFGKIGVSEIMTPRIDVVAVDYNTSLPELIQIILNSGYSRMPVYRETFDQVEGILYIKDILPFMDEAEDFEWQKLLRQPLFVPENKKIDDLLTEFQFKKVHLAIVVDEYGGSSGLVTLEDILEEIIGEINDEFDDEDLGYSKIDENNFVFEAKTAINLFLRVMNENEDMLDDVKGEADTLAGLILELVGKIPSKNEVIEHNNFRFLIEAADNRRIKRIKVTRMETTENE